MEDHSDQPLSRDAIRDELSDETVGELIESLIKVCIAESQQGSLSDRDIVYRSALKDEINTRFVRIRSSQQQEEGQPPENESVGSFIASTFSNQ